MKRTFIFSLIFMVALTTSNVFAQRPGFGQDKPMGERFQKYNNLNLTDDQKTQIDKLRLEHQKEILPLRNEVHNLQSEYKLLIIDNKVSEAKLKKHAENISSLRETLSLKHALHQRQVRSLLTDEQKVKFDQHIISGRGQKGPRGQKGCVMGQDGRRGNRNPRK